MARHLRFGLTGAALIGLSLASGPAFADFQAGERAFRSSDFAGAARNWQEAANGGDARAHFGLAGLYEKGQGVPADPVQAFVHYNIADTLGHAGARTARDRLQEQMSESDIRSARKKSIEAWNALFAIMSEERRGSGSLSGIGTATATAPAPTTPPSAFAPVGAGRAPAGPADPAKPTRKVEAPPKIDRLSNDIARILAETRALADRTGAKRVEGPDRAAEQAPTETRAAQPQRLEAEAAQPLMAQTKTAPDHTVEPQTVEPQMAQPQTAQPQTAQPQTVETRTSQAQIFVAPAEPSRSEPEGAPQPSAKADETPVPAKEVAPEQPAPAADPAPRQAERLPERQPEPPVLPRSREQAPAPQQAVEIGTTAELQNLSDSIHALVQRALSGEAGKPPAERDAAAQPESGAAEPAGDATRDGQVAAAMPRDAAAQDAPDTAEPKTAEPKMAEPRTAEPKMAEPKTAEPKTAEAEAPQAESPPAQAQRAETTPVESAQVESAPAESTPAESSAAETARNETPPAEPARAEAPSPVELLAGGDPLAALKALSKLIDDAVASGGAPAPGKNKAETAPTALSAAVEAPQGEAKDADVRPAEADAQAPVSSETRQDAPAPAPDQAAKETVATAESAGADKPMPVNAPAIAAAPVPDATTAAVAPRPEKGGAEPSGTIAAAPVPRAESPIEPVGADAPGTLPAPQQDIYIANLRRALDSRQVGAGVRDYADQPPTSPGAGRSRGPADAQDDAQERDLSALARWVRSLEGRDKETTTPGSAWHQADARKRDQDIEALAQQIEGLRDWSNAPNIAARPPRAVQQSSRPAGTDPAHGEGMPMQPGPNVQDTVPQSVASHFRDLRQTFDGPRDGHGYPPLPLRKPPPPEALRMAAPNMAPAAPAPVPGVIQPAAPAPAAPEQGRTPARSASFFRRLSDALFGSSDELPPPAATPGPERQPGTGNAPASPPSRWAPRN